MNKKNWMLPEVIVLEIESTEADAHTRTVPYGQFFIQYDIKTRIINEGV
jgi:hypothetical protein